jgi:hypothetical protein
MAKPKPYNGHRSWNAWNVAAHLGNDETLYLMCMKEIERAITLEQAVRKIRARLPEKTPDGAPYNRMCVREAVDEWWAERNERRRQQPEGQSMTAKFVLP